MERYGECLLIFTKLFGQSDILFLTEFMGRCANAQRPAVYCTSVYCVEAQPSTIGSCGITIASTI